jgi:hypothetical protein
LDSALGVTRENAVGDYKGNGGGRCPYPVAKVVGNKTVGEGGIGVVLEAHPCTTVDGRVARDGAIDERG